MASCASVTVDASRAATIVPVIAWRPPVATADDAEVQPEATMATVPTRQPANCFIFPCAGQCSELAARGRGAGFRGRSPEVADRHPTRQTDRRPIDKNGPICARTTVAPDAEPIDGFAPYNLSPFDVPQEDE